jgi:DNA-directed RNA polymerase specialized sigma24 family protein
VTSAPEVFVIVIARASRRARRYLRRMTREDRDDVLSTAILWCWENRVNYDPSLPLEDWFVGAVRDAKKKFRRGEAHAPEELSERLAAPDDTPTSAAAHEAAEQLVRGLTRDGREVLSLIAHGYTRSEIVSRGYTGRQYDETRTRVRQLRRLGAETGNLRPLLRTGVTPTSGESDDKPWSEVVTIDFAPHEGQECPPCWKCKWFEGLLPPRKRSTRMDIVELDVRQAIEDTEARKALIAQRVIDGTINDGRRA